MRKYLDLAHKPFLKCGTYLGFNAIKMLKKIYLALLTEKET